MSYYDGILKFTFTEASIANAKSEIDSYLDRVCSNLGVDEITLIAVIHITASNDTVSHTFEFMLLIYDTTEALINSMWAAYATGITNIIAASDFDSISSVFGSVDIEVLASGKWVSYFDNTKWEAESPEYGTWDGSAWIAGQEGEEEDYAIDLTPIGDWEVNFRPTKMRITHTHPAGEIQNDFILHNACYGSGCPDVVVSDANLESGSEKVCFFDGYDISELSMSSTYDDGSFTITNIEFLVE